MVARIPIFIIYSILTCCCDKGHDYPEEEEFKDRIISFDFTEYELGMLNNFDNHVYGLNEIEYNRNLSVIRRTMRLNQEEAAAARAEAEGWKPNASAKMKKTFRKTIVGMMGASQRGTECSICTVPFESG